MADPGYWIENELKDPFGKANKNSDGKIGITEFILNSNKINPDLAKVFGQLDTDHDGLINKDGVRSALQAIGKDLSDSDLESYFHKADANKEGKLDITEFSCLIKQAKPYSYYNCVNVYNEI